jgi:cyclic pyranopterin phosphate synthase
MPNVLLTNFCNRACPYCFAKEKVRLGAVDREWEISEEEMESILGFLQPGRDMVSLLGGEPTLHSRYPQIVREVADRGFPVTVFTNAATPHLRAGVPESGVHGFSVVINLNPRETYSAEELAEIEANCRALGGAVRLSMNVSRPDFTWDFHRSVILDWGIARYIRVGIAQPIKGEKNEFLAGKAVKATCGRIVQMAEALAEDGIAIGFDCGFRLCAFTEEERGILLECGTLVSFSCTPAIDIGPDLQVWRCFALSGDPSVKLLDFPHIEAVSRHFENERREQALWGNLKKCRECEHMIRGTCNGGCLSRTLNAQEDG